MWCDNIMSKLTSTLLYSLTGAAAIASLSSCKSNKQAEPQKPMNVIYIMSDDHSYQTISAYDQRYIHTPNIDRIGNEGVRFTNSFVANSISGPSRACMLTGKHSHANGFINNSTTFNGDQLTFPKVLQQNGYQTAMAKFTRRHRHGRTLAIRYAHAFTKWPDRFEKTHMDYFGVSPYGKPGIPSMRKYAKLCLSNPAVIDQIIADWKAAGARKYLNVSPNDGTAGYCHCAKCMALDTRKEGENFYSHLTDRYLNFWNRILKRAKKINPDVMLVTYVYSYYRHPPRREKIEYPDSMLCGLVPVLAEDSEALFKAWKAVGMKHCFLRPNDTHPASTLLRGMEKRIYEKFQSVRRNFKLYGVDYDGTLGVRSRDLEHYIICRMIADPEKSFDELIDEYCSAFGAAADVVKEF